MAIKAFMLIQTNVMFRMYVYSHFFKIVNPTPRVIGLILQFCTKYVLKSFIKEKNKKPELKITKVFAVRIRNNTEFRFHIGQLSDFMIMLERNYITTDFYSTEYIPLYEPQQINVSLLPKWKLYDYQQNIVNFIKEEAQFDNKSRLVTSPTGSGKTLSSLAAISEIKTRTMIVLLAMYIEKWSSDIVKILDVKPKEVMIVQGSSQLKGLIDLAKENNFDSKFVIVSIDTIQNFYKAYETYGKDIESEGYSCMPEDLCKLLKIGTIIIDETHQHLHAVYKLLTYTHVPKVVALSATFISNNHVINTVQHLMYPREIRFEKLNLPKYAKVFSLGYSFSDLKSAKIRTTEFGSNVYSQTAFEKSIMKNPTILNKYLEMIYYLINISYLDEYVDKDKLAIYAGSIAMCNKILYYITPRLKHLDVRRYVEQDPYENVIDADVRVTTIISAGTAIDIPNLRAVIMTNNIDSPVANLQTLGRLRNLPDRDVKFYYCYCDQIPKQHDYHLRKKQLFADRVISHKDFFYNKIL